jgi:hypothetical protein
MTQTLTLVVVTIVKDDCDAFAKTLESIRVQNQSLKHVVIDGSSNEENQKLIASSSGDAGSVYMFQSAKGIYSAMNRGLGECRDDELVLFLNAGDCFANSGSASQVVADSSNDGVDFLIYPCIFGESNGFIPSIQGATAKNVARGKALVCHQGVVAKAGLIRQAGAFDETYSISADHKLLLSLLQISKATLSSIPLAVVSLGGVSDTKCGALVRENSRARAETGMAFNSRIADKSYTFVRLTRCKAKLSLRKALKSVGLSGLIFQRLIHRNR